MGELVQVQIMGVEEVQVVVARQQAAREAQEVGAKCGYGAGDEKGIGGPNREGAERCRGRGGLGAASPPHGHPLGSGRSG